MLIMSLSCCQTLCFIPSASIVCLPRHHIKTEDQFKGQLSVNSQELWSAKSKMALVSRILKQLMWIALSSSWKQNTKHFVRIFMMTSLQRHRYKMLIKGQCDLFQTVTQVHKKVQKDFLCCHRDIYNVTMEIPLFLVLKLTVKDDDSKHHTISRTVPQLSDHNFNRFELLFKEMYSLGHLRRTIMNIHRVFTVTKFGKATWRLTCNRTCNSWLYNLFKSETALWNWMQTF